MLGPFTIVLLILVAAPRAQAAGIEAKERAARKACLSGDYAKGVEMLSDLFLDTMDPNYIFNQARCFEQNNRYEEAIGRFREFLRKATKIAPADKAETEKHIADCQAILGQKPASEPKAEAAPAGTAAPIPAPAAVSAPTVSPQPPASEQVAVAAQPAATATNPGRGLRIAGITFGALGVASVGTAVYFYTRAKSYSDKVSGQTIPNPSDESAGKRAQTMQWVFYSVGAAAIATGTVLYLLGWTSADSGRTTAGVAPILGPGLAGISAQGAF
jgi:tetratricopeptide (TPR) repeat protein